MNVETESENLWNSLSINRSQSAISDCYSNDTNSYHEENINVCLDEHMPDNLELNTNANNNDRYYVIDDKTNKISKFENQQNYIEENDGLIHNNHNVNIKLSSSSININSQTKNSNIENNVCSTQSKNDEFKIEKVVKCQSVKSLNNNSDRIDKMIHDLRLSLSNHSNEKNFNETLSVNSNDKISESSKSHSGFTSLQEINKNIGSDTEKEIAMLNHIQDRCSNCNHNREIDNQEKPHTNINKIFDKGINTDICQLIIPQPKLNLPQIFNVNGKYDIEKMEKHTNNFYDTIHKHLEALTDSLSLPHIITQITLNNPDEKIGNDIKSNPAELINYIRHIQTRTRQLYQQINLIIRQNTTTTTTATTPVPTTHNRLKSNNSVRDRHYSESRVSKFRQRSSGDIFHLPFCDSIHDDEVYTNISVPAPSTNIIDYRKYYRVFELNPFDDIIRSYKSQTDRRIKSLSNKMNCRIEIDGPYKLYDSTNTCWNTRNKTAYRVVIYGFNNDSLDKCIKCIHDSFPQSYLHERFSNINQSGELCGDH